MAMRVGVAKTYKLYVGGAFVRSESGRHDPVHGAGGEHVANVPRGSRKDVRDAVKAARGAAGGWSRKTAYNRGQVLYRAAEALEARAAEFAERGAGDVGEAVDRLGRHARRGRKQPALLGGGDTRA